ncbi:MAG: hypothetical protein II662_05425, partial [Bacteroidales bacterium]|nr:hypothetical protein [Bacteroidales bacterium]
MRMLSGTFISLKAIIELFWKQVMKNRLFIAILLIINILFSCKEKNDAVVSYWPDGKVKSELRYADDKLNGLCKWYYSNGNPSMEAVYENNVLNGPSTRWYENGNLE